jgi:hypothetical protein
MRMFPLVRLLTGISLRQSEIVVVKIKTHKWTVSKSRLRSASTYFMDKLADPSVEIAECPDSSPVAFELFLQWLHTNQYQEYDGYAPDFETSGDYCLRHQSERTTENIAWCVKAAVLGHNEGWTICAPRFQDYAKRRLFQACRREVPKANVTPAMAWESLGHLKLGFLLGDYIIQNWGDKAVIDHELKEWADIVRDDGYFRARFTKAMGVPLHVRQKRLMAWKDYLVSTD